MPDSLGHVAVSDPKKKIMFGKYQLGRLLGRGGFAKVYHARNISTGQSVAIKTIQKSRVAKPILTKNILREVSILRRFRHPHIVRLYEVLASKNKIHLLLEFAKGGELFDKVANSGKLDEDLSRKYFRQLISAVGYCHSRGVFHRDLKPENLLLDEFGDLLVSDFGLAAVHDQTRPDGLLHTLCGTPAYVAPEILTKKGYDGAGVDVWSCGVILFVLNAGYLPFNDSNLMNMYRKIYRGEYRFPKWTSPELRRLISGILDTNPETRMTVDEIINDPWFGKGMGEEERTAMMKFHYEEQEEEEKEEEEERELNAFDIIGFASDLSGLFDSDSVRERFVSGLSAEGILGRLEDVGRSEGLFVRRRGEKGLVLEGQNGNLGLRVRVLRLTADVSMVEVAKGGEVWAQDLWREKVGPTIRGRG